MSSVLTKRTLASVLRSPALAVVAAYALRMVLLWLAHLNEDPVNPRFETIGLENNLVAMSLARSKGFFGPYPGYEAVTAVLAPVYPWMSAIGKKLFGERVGLASAWLWVFLPYAVLFPLEWTWDQSLAALMLASIVCATLKLRESTSALHWSGYGLLWGFTALVNPTVCLLLPFMLAWLMI